MTEISFLRFAKKHGLNAICFVDSELSLKGCTDIKGTFQKTATNVRQNIL